jgi:cell division septal protein FtsQ
MQIQSIYYKPKKRKKNRKPFLWVAVGLIIILGITYVILFLPFWKIKKVEANGTEKISSAELISAVEEYLNGFQLTRILKGNYLFFSEEKLVEYLKSNFPGLKEISVNKKLPPSLIVEARDRQKAIVYCGREQCFYLDDDGIAFEPAPEIYGGLKVVLKDNSGRETKPGNKMIEASLINFMLEIQKVIIDDLNMSLVNFEIVNYPTSDINVEMPEDWKIMLDSKLSPQEQISALKKVLDDKIKDQRGQLEYIDLRIGNRVYYKMKN